MRILIYGAGALGQAVGCLLAADGHDIDLVLRPRYKEAILKKGLSVAGLYGDFHVEPENIGLHEVINSVRNTVFDYVLITTKAFDTNSAVSQLDGISIQSFTAVSLQNGCGNFEILIEKFGEARSLAGRVITGFEIVRPATVMITVSADAIHIGGSREGHIPEKADRLASAINKSGLPCEATPYIQQDLHAKLLYNCALNPLGAILGVPYGALADDPATRKIMDQVIDETFAVITASGGAIHWQDGSAYRTFFYEKQVPATYNHRPSMLQDIENGKPTEVDALTGYVSTLGRKYGVVTPTCDLLSHLIRFKGKQSNTSSRRPARRAP